MAPLQWDLSEVLRVAQDHELK